MAQLYVMIFGGFRYAFYMLLYTAHPFKWTATKEKSYDALKVMLTQATVLNH